VPLHHLEPQPFCSPGRGRSLCRLRCVRLQNNNLCILNVKVFVILEVFAEVTMKKCLKIINDNFPPKYLFLQEAHGVSSQKKAFFDIVVISAKCLKQEDEIYIFYTKYITDKQINSVILRTQANYADWATATCCRNLVPTFVDRSGGQRGGSLTVVNLSFLDRSRYFPFK
jgi:hypothetical protein